LVDVARCGDRAFLNAASVGFDAEVAAVAARAGAFLRSSGPLLYPLALLRALPRYAVRPMRVELDRTAIERHALLVAIANGPFYGGGFRICPAADPGDGWLDVCILGDLSLPQAIRLLPQLRAGTHVGASRVEHFRARVVRISGTPAPVQLDGEPAGTAPAEFRLMARALSLCGATDDEMR
jgi:diacylglycerol kinase (ATP)